MRRKRQEGSPSRRMAGNIEIDPALAQQLVLIACHCDPTTGEYICPECEVSADSAKNIKHDEDCPIGHLFARASARLEGEIG